MKFIEALEAGQAGEKLHELAEMNAALSWMVYCTCQQGDPIGESTSNGLSLLMEMQADLMREVVTWVHLKDDVIKDYGRQIEKYERQIEELTTRQPAPTPVAKTLRDEFIASKAREGVDAGDIAAAMNMKRTSIDRVIAQLGGASEPPEGQQRKAVNG